MPTISFLILTYNSSRFVEPLLNSLDEKLGKKIEIGNYEVIVVDNDSKDDTADKIRKHPLHKSLRLFENSSNAGYAKGINLAATKAKGEFLVIINPDSVLIKSDFNKAIEFFNDRKCAIAGFKILNNSGVSELNAGKFYNPITFLLFCAGLEEKFGLRFSPSISTKVDYVSGGFMMIRREIYNELLGFDERYFMYVEDMDLCFRAKKLGYDTYFLPMATIKHAGQGSSSREFAIINIYKGLIHFFAKNNGKVHLLYVKSLLRIKAALIIFIGSLVGKYDLVTTYKKALRMTR